jgi:hypothetical protein
MSEKLDPDQINRLFEHSLHVDTMLHNRMNFFLVFESVLLSVVSVLYSRPSSPKAVLFTIICLGFVLTLLWGYVQARQKWVRDSLKAFRREVMPEYEMTMKRREQVKWPIDSTTLTTYGVPPLVGLVWIVLLIFTIIS